MVKLIKLRTARRIARLFALLTVVLLVALPMLQYTAYAASYDARVFAQDQTIHRGQTFEVDINVADNTGLLTLYLTVKFDHSVFTLIDVQQIRQALGELNLEQSGSGYDYIDEKTGGFNLFWDGSRADSTNGTIVRLTFQSSMTAPIGTYPIDIVLGAQNTTVAYNVPASVQVTSPKITLIEGAYIVVWHDWDGNAIQNTNISGHPYNHLTGGYEYNSDDGLNPETDFPNDPSRPEDSMYRYTFSGWEGAVWRGDVPEGSSVIYYIAKYLETPKVYNVWYYVDGVGNENAPDGEITEDELYTAKLTSYNSIINDSDIPLKQDYTFYGWFTDPGFTRKLVSPLMPANDVKLYGYFKYNIRETDIPVLQLTYRETITNGELENIAYVDVNITRNYGLSSLMITLSEYDTENFTFCGFEKGDIFKQMSFFTTNYENDEYPENFSFSWNNSYKNSYELGCVLVLKFRLNPGSSPGAYPVSMTADTQNTTYVNSAGEIWYSNIEFQNTKIPIGKTNYWKEPVPATDVTIEVESPSYVPYNVELIVKTEKVEDVIDEKIISDFLDESRLVYSLFDIYFQQNATKLTQEQYRQLFGEENVVVKIKLTSAQLSSKKLDIYYVDDDGKMTLYESVVENGYLIFETNHFSHWALVGDYVLTNPETANLRLLRISLLLFGLAACMLIAIAFVRNRKKQPLFDLFHHFIKNKGG